MSEISKQALKVDNNQSFPNNNAGAITPTILRDFNTNMIDSLVDEISYNADSASWNSKIQALDSSGSAASVAALNQFTSSALITASFDNGTRNLTFTKGNLSTFSVNIPDVSGSDSNLTALNQATASLQAFTASIAGTNAFTQSAQLEINSLEAFTASIAGTNAFTASTTLRLNSLESTSASVNTSLASLNGFTASVAGTNTFTQSAQVSITALNAATSSYAKTNVDNRFTTDQTITGSLVVTGTITANELHVIIESSSIIYSSGSNQLGDALNDTQILSGSTKLVGTAELNGSPLITSAQTASYIQDLTALNQFTASVAGTNAFTQSAQQSINAINAISGTWITEAESGSFIKSAGSSGTNVIQFTYGDGSITNVTVATGSATDISALNAFTASIAGTNAFTQSAQLEINALEAATGSYANSASVAAVDLAQQNQINSLIAASGSFDNSALNAFTASIAGTNAFTASTITSLNSINGFTQSAQLEINALEAFTASIDARVDSLEAVTASYATTGSNTFIGNQTITGSLIVTGSANVVGQLTASSLRVENNTHLDGTLRVTNDAQFDGHILIQGASPHLKLRDTSGGGFSSGYDVRVNTGSFEIYDDTHNRNVLSDIYNPSTLKHTTVLSSEITVISGSESVTIQGALTASLQDGYVWVGNGSNKIQAVSTSSFASLTDLGPLNAFTASVAGTNAFTQSAQVSINALNAATSSYAISASVAAVDLAQQTQINSLTSATGSYAKLNSANTFNANQIVSGSMTVTGNLEVFGSASFTTVTSSVFIGGNTIILNTFTPSVRFGGLEVIDSGSTGLTGSLLWDSEKDKWIYTNPSGGMYNSGMLISGPRNTGSVGEELGVTFNAIMKGMGGDHISSSQMTDDGVTVTLPYTASIGNIVGLGNPTAFSTSVDSRINAIVVPSLASLNNATASLNSATASLFTSASLAVKSISPTLTSLQFDYVKGDGSSQTVTLVAPAGTDITALNQATASLNAATASLNSATASLYTSASLALKNASATLNTITFTKGDDTTFNVTVNTGSAITFPYTGSAVISGSLGVTGSISVVSSSFSGAVITNLTDTYTDVAAVQQIVTITSASYSSLVTGGTTNPNTLYVVTGQTAGATVGSNTFVGTQTISGSVQGKVNSVSITSLTASIDFSTGNFFTLELAAGVATHILPTNIQPGETVTIRIIQNATPGTVTYPASVKFPTGNAYVASTTAGAVDIITFVTLDNTTAYANSVKALV